MKDINLLLLLLLFFLKQIFKLYLSVVYLGVSGARHKNERDCIQSEEKQTGGRSTGVFSISNVNRFFNSHCSIVDETIQCSFVPLPNVISVSE